MRSPSSPLVTTKDFLHFHKILGFACLASVFGRVSILLGTGLASDIGFNTPFVSQWTLHTLAMHGLLALSAFTFVVPQQRTKAGFQIWREYRLHSAIFSLRSILIMTATWIKNNNNSKNNNPNNSIITTRETSAFNLLVILGSMALADYASASQGYHHSGFVRDLKVNPAVKFYFSCMQFAATSACLVDLERFTTQYLFLFIIQANSFLMTLQRKNKFSRNTLIGVYAISMFLCFWIILTEYILFGGTALLCVVGLVCNACVIIRILPTYWSETNNTKVKPQRALKYVLWLMVGMMVTLYRPEYGARASPVLWACFLSTELVILATGLKIFLRHGCP